MIPKIIHYFWENKRASDSIPAKILKDIESWKKYCPDWEIKLWNKDTFDTNSSKFVKQAYDAGMLGFVPDYIRLWCLYNYGGIYLDADVEILKPIDELLNNKCFFAWEHEQYNPKFLGTAIIGAEKGNSVIKYLLDAYDDQDFVDKDNNIIVPASNIHMMNIMKENNYEADIALGNLKIYDQKYIYPENDSFITKDAYFIHRSMASWVRIESIVIPTYNNKNTIRKCLESAINQNISKLHYEIICVDDKSTDGTIDIIKEFSDMGVVLIEKSEHTGLGDTIEIGINRASGYAITILNPKQEMDTNTSARVAYMAYPSTGKINNADVIVIAQPGTLNNPKMDNVGGKYVDLTLENIRDLSLDFNSIIISKKFKEKFYTKRPQWFYSYYRGDIMEQFIMLCLTNDIYVVAREEFPFTNHIKPLSEGSRNILNNNPNSRLTSCIVFRNEGNEIEQTIKSIKYTCKNPNILLIDDCSTDGVDYAKLAQIYNCSYKRMQERVGSVGTKDWAGRSVDTEYFVLLDGHMRFYENDWDEYLINTLDKNPNTILSPRTVYLGIDDNKKITKEDSYGKNEHRAINARITFEEGYEYDPKWTNNQHSLNDGLCDVPCILGACYATSKEWWKKIDGLNGLIVYGLEETFLSLKTWAMGGYCKCPYDHASGHVYRSVNPNGCSANDLETNRLIIAYIFDKDFETIKEHVKEKVKEDRFKFIYKKFEVNLNEINQIKNYVIDNTVHDIDWFKTNINNPVT